MMKLRASTKQMVEIKEKLKLDRSASMHRRQIRAQINEELAKSNFDFFLELNLVCI